MPFHHSSRYVTPFCLALFLMFTTPSAGYGDDADQQQGVVEIGSRLEPMFDEHLVAQKSGAIAWVMHPPTMREIAIVFDKPWEGNTSGYPTVLHDGAIYRMYYRGHRFVWGPDKFEMGQSEVFCYAESDDGIHWKKPNLGLHVFNGSKENNIFLVGTGRHNFAPFIDLNPHCLPDEKYKAVGGINQTGLLAFKSADGVHWSRMSDKPVLEGGALDSRNSPFWDPVRQQYALYIRVISTIEGQSLRDIAVTYSDDFKNWSEPAALAYPGSPPQQMYTNQIIPYYRAPHVMLGFPTRYVARETTEHLKSIDPVQLRAELAAGYERVGSDLTDGLLMTSRDGVAFKRWDEAFLRPGPQSEGRWLYGDNYQGYGLFETKSPVPGGPNEISFHFSEGTWRNDERRQRRYTVRLDGFVSAQAKLKGGEFVTRPIRFTGNKLVVNYSTSAAGSLKVEIQNVDGQSIPGFGLAESIEHIGDSISQTIHWKSGTDVSGLAGQVVRLRFVLSDADLYSLQFQQ